MNLKNKTTTKRKLALLAVILFVIALLSKQYTGIFAHIVHSFAADILAVVILILLGNILFIKTSPLIISSSVFLFALAIELFQLVNQSFRLIAINNQFLHIILGSTFDLLDILSYAVGAIIGFVLLKKLSL